MRWTLFATIGLSLTACQSDPIYRDRPVEVNIPVAVPCATTRPQKPEPLAGQTPDWEAYDVRQKSAWVGRQALAWQTYGEQLYAATAACPEVDE